MKNHKIKNKNVRNVVLIAEKEKESKMPILNSYSEAYSGEQA